MNQGRKSCVTKKVTQAMLSCTNRRLDVGSVNITDFKAKESKGVLRIYGCMYSCMVRFQEKRKGYFVTLSSHEDYISFFANNGLSLGSSIAFEGFYDNLQNLVIITARKVVGNQIIYIPADDVSAHVVASNNAARPAAPLPNSGASTKAVRARRSPATKAGACNDGRRVSARLANKQPVAPFTFAGPSGSTPASASISASLDKETADILLTIDQAFTLAADEANAAAVNTNVLESLSPARGDSPGVAGEDGRMEEAGCAPQSTLDTFFSAKSSILGKRKAEEQEVDSLNDTAASILCEMQQDEEELEIEDQVFNAALEGAKAKLENLVAARLADLKKRRRMSCRAPSAATASAGDANPTSTAAPACPPSSCPTGKNKKGPQKLGVVRKVATKKAAAGGAGGKIRKTAAKSRVNPCLDVGMRIAFPTNDAVYGSIATEDNIRQSRRIRARRLAAQIVAKTSANRRRKQSMPALAALW